VLIPIFIFIVWIGVYPNTFLKLTDAFSVSLLHQVTASSSSLIK